MSHVILLEGDGHFGYQRRDSHTFQQSDGHKKPAMRCPRCSDEK
jgi:hypothetical protein